jgi:hypothetical protein
VRRDANRCPECGERVTPFAAGCALCGADLDPQRHTRSPGPVSRWSPALPTLPGVNHDVVAAIVLTLLALFAPLLGLLISGLRAYGEERAGRVRQRNIALAFAAICGVFLLFPVSQIDLLNHLGLP